MPTLLEPILNDAIKTKPLCPVFGRCGGCSYQDRTYADELSMKERSIFDKLTKEIGLKESVFHPIVASPKSYHYRHRLDLKLQRSRNGIFIGFTPKEGRGILPIDSCPIALESISQAIPRIKEEALAKIPDRYRRANLTIRGGDDGRVVWGGIGRGSLKIQEEDYLWTAINGKRIFYAMETFFQANLSILPKLINTIRSFNFLNKEATLYDLYGGVGLFGINLADLVNEVHLIEEVSSSIQLAQYNASYHHLSNFHILEGRVEDCLTDLKGKNNVAMIDPPRAGLSNSARTMLINMEGINYFMYLSCNPDALVKDLKAFVDSGWSVKNVTPFDFFPRTKHIETLVVMEK